MASFLAVFSAHKALDDHGMDIPVIPKFTTGLAVHPEEFPYRIVQRFPCTSETLTHLTGLGTLTRGNRAIVIMYNYEAGLLHHHPRVLWDIDHSSCPLVMNWITMGGRSTWVQHASGAGNTAVPKCETNVSRQNWLHMRDKSQEDDSTSDIVLASEAKRRYPHHQMTDLQAQAQATHCAK
ncbi:uncharacterized protein HD556DRAFT_1306988 [Suillus plorans]|uniref:Uncharacterized protein n=1 Tax=Suillus plorans TaxID=116603 RepID=A0A9P7IXM2_9AGAM|nr:uncharacterized protein HD556DRAFT_1306988 [Suillus plorans]KAG1796827.1 hypothetical protein HD556DRAFT_1306988 [Suillus plorans]